MHGSSTPASPDAQDPKLPSFGELGLPQDLVRALARRGITEPFPIQAATLPDALAGRDVLGRGQTGSGKTLAFGLPLLARLAGEKAKPKRPRGLVLVPTRELAMQVSDALQPLAHAIGLSVRVVMGGAAFGKQVDGLRRGVDVVVATPGRLTDLIQQGACDLSQVEIAILDEADHMTDLGFLPAVSALLDMVRADGQRLLFSATLDQNVDVLVKRYLTSPVTHSTAPPSAAVATMEHHLLVVHPADKAAVTAEIANREGRTILFVRTQHGADRLATQLGRQGVAAGSLHGGKTQGARSRTLAEFREGRVPVLVATNVAARGIHVDDVSLVLHVDPPTDPKDYLHRAGRTARAGESGTVVTLVTPQQQRVVDQMTTKAGVTAIRARVRPGDATLTELGARKPSGEPVIVVERVETERSSSRRSTKPYGRGRTAGTHERFGSDRPKRAPRANDAPTTRRSGQATRQFAG